VGTSEAGSALEKAEQSRARRLFNFAFGFLAGVLLVAPFAFYLTSPSWMEALGWCSAAGLTLGSLSGLFGDPFLKGMGSFLMEMWRGPL